jgi:hypothetical protein
MSGQQNVYDNLRDDEPRSEEGSTMGSDTAEFFVDDDVPVRVHGSGGGVDILARDDTRVPDNFLSAQR